MLDMLEAPEDLLLYKVIGSVGGTGGFADGCWIHCYTFWVFAFGGRAMLRGSGERAAAPKRAGPALIGSVGGTRGFAVGCWVHC